MKALAFRPGERVADIGAGRATSPSRSRTPSADRRVLALDIAAEMLEYLELRVKARQAANISLRKVTSDDPQLEPGSVDTVLLVDTIHYVKDRIAYGRSSARAGAGWARRHHRLPPKPMSERPGARRPISSSEGADGQGDGCRRVHSPPGFRLPAEQFFVIYAPSALQ